MGGQDHCGSLQYGDQGLGQLTILQLVLLALLSQLLFLNR